ncbi:MAG: thiamine phosphate synthase [Oscillospiraceae bacterium]
MESLKIISITNRKLCNMDFLSQVREISFSGLVKSIYLREKDLSPQDYKNLFKNCLEICSNDVEIFGVKYIDITKSLGVKNVHLSYEDFILNHDTLNDFVNVSVSVHQVSEAIHCEKLGATRLITGHIFQTDCKKGLAPRGLEYLKNICESVSIPVFAIGGISSNNVKSVIEHGAEGVCIMSSLMQTDNPKLLLKDLISQV